MSVKIGRLSVSTWYGGLAPWARWSSCSHHHNLRVGVLGRRVGLYWRRRQADGRGRPARLRYRYGYSFGGPRRPNAPPARPPSGGGGVSR